MPVSRIVSWEIEAKRGHNVWEILCRTALRGVDLAAKLLGLPESDGRVEGGESLIGYAVHLAPLPSAPQPIDWAKLGELERGRVAREIRRTPPC